MPSTAFAARMPYEASCPVCGLDYPFTLSRTIRGLGAARLVSTPSRLSSRRAWLGVATDEEVSPTLSSSASPVSRRALKFFSSPLRLPFRHARAQPSDFLSIIEHGPLLSPVRLAISPSRLAIILPWRPGEARTQTEGFGFQLRRGLRQPRHCSRRAWLLAGCEAPRGTTP